MAKKASKAGRGDRTDPTQNQSLAIRNVLAKMPDAKAADVAAAVKKEYGHDVAVNRIYMLKTKANMKASRRKTGGQNGAASANGGAGRVPMNSAATWVHAIKLGRQLLQATGSAENATALLKAIDS